MHVSLPAGSPLLSLFAPINPATLGHGGRGGYCPTPSSRHVPLALPFPLLHKQVDEALMDVGRNVQPANVQPAVEQA